MSNHSPGPWIVFGDSVMAPYGERTKVEIANVRHVLADGTHLPQVANAHLIAAAPDMYEALMTVYGFIAGEHEDFTLERVEREVCAALAKAER